VATNDAPPALGGAEYLRLVGLGAMIGIPAAFLAAVFLAFVHDLEHPGFVAAAIGYVIFIGLGHWGGLVSQSLAVSSLPPYNGTHVYDLLVGVAIGVATPLVIVAVRRLAEAVAGYGLDRRKLPALLLTGGLGVGPSSPRLPTGGA
jgi:hypothetical protein